MKKISFISMVMAFTALTFTACEDVPAPEGYNTTPNEEEQTPTAEPTGDGTLENPFNVAAAIAKCKEIGSTESTEKYYVKGIAVTEGTPDASFGNATFEIGDFANSTSTFTAFQVLGTDGNKMPTTYTIPAGAEVVLYGPIYNYKGNTPETAGKGAAYIVSVNGQPTEVIGGQGNDIGSIDAPLSIAEAITVIEGLGDNETTNDFYFVKGTISTISTTGTDVAKYHNIIYTISDGSKTLKIYKGRNLDNTDFTEDGQINIGDEVIVYGNLQKFIDNSGKMVPEMADGNYIVKLTKGTAPEPTGDIGSIDAPKTVAEALAVINALEEGATTDANYYVKGKVAKVATAAEDIGPNSTSGKKYKDINYYISDDGSESNTIYVYRGKNLNNTDFTSADQLKVGDEVIVYGKLQKYKDTKKNEIVPEMAQGNYLVKTDNTGGETPETPENPEQPGGEVSGNSITIAMQALGLANATALDTQTLSDGTQLIFAAEENQNAPKYYDGGTNARVYAKNSLTIKSAGKNITKVVLTCTANYLGNEQLYGEADGKKVTIEKGDTDVTFSGFSSQILKIVNDYTQASSGTQLRIVSITITYAE